MAELAFCFDNTKRCEQGTGNGPEAQALVQHLPAYSGRDTWHRAQGSRPSAGLPF
jgi:hypothetical protein